MGDLRKKLVRAQRRTRKEVGLENALPKWWGLKGELKRKEVGLANALTKSLMMD